MRNLAVCALLLLPSAAKAELDVKIPAHANWELTGKLALPENPGQATPVVVLLHGSGPADMDETMSSALTDTGRPAGIFKDISGALARAGFAVFRYNKRGVLGWDAAGERPVVDAGVYGAITVDDLRQDAVAVMKYLRGLPRFAGSPLILLGHSEGTMLAPLAAREAKADGLALLGAMGRRLDALVYYQLVTRNIDTSYTVLDADRDGYITESEAQAEPRISLNFPVTDADKDGRISREELVSVLEAQYAGAEAQMKRSPWYRSHLRAEPNSAVLPGFSGPVLILQGEEDRQTPLVEARLLETALRDAGHGDYTVKTFPGLGHGFSPPRDGWLPTLGPVQPEVLDRLSGWLSAKFLARPAPSVVLAK